MSTLIVSCILMVCCLPSCKNSFGSHAEVQGYINDSGNGLSSSLENGDVDMKLNWQPWQTIGARLNHRMEESGELSKYYFFILSFSKNNKELLRHLDHNTYSKILQVFSFRMKDYVSVVSSNNELISPVDCLFQQTYGVSNANKILLVFAKSDLEHLNDLKFIIKEFGLELGTMNFYIRTRNMALFNELKY